MEKIAHYEIQSEIGRGGFGQVYRAYDPRVRRFVAIKVLNCSDPQMLSRFHLEATAAGNLNHPNIVTIHEYGEHNGQPYLVMEYLEGRDLQRTMEAGPQLDLLQIADVMSDVADGLHCAHQSGVIHRDIKPANIMLLTRGGVKLMDFGIARLTGENTLQTKTGYLIGTVLYMSPEQFQNSPLDARIDIWAYGVIYYQLLAGKHPFQVPDQLGTMYNIVNTPAPPICSVAPEVPEALGQIVDRCLAKDRDVRYHTMEDLRFDMLPVLQDLQKQYASKLIDHARELVSGNKIDEAHTVVRRVLELDPGDRTAHALRKSIADEIQRRAVQPRVEMLARSADEQLAARQYSKALENLEAAARLDPAASVVRQQLERVKGLVDRDRKAAELVQAARRELDEDNLTGAHRNVSEALRTQPDYPGGRELLDSIQVAIGKRDSDRRLQEGLSKARGLVRVRSFDDAIAILADLNENFPGTAEASQLLREAEAQREEHNRRRRLHNELEAARELLKQHRFEDAVHHLEALEQEFQGEYDLDQLLYFAREESKIRQRAATLERIKAHVVTLQNGARFDDALKFLDRALTEFPGETDLLRLSQNVLAAKGAAERRTAIQEAIRQAETLRQNGQVTEALRCAEMGLRLHGPDGDLVAFRDQIERDWQASQRAAGLAKAQSEGRLLLDRRQYEHAIAHLENERRLYPEDASLKTMLADAVRAKEKQERERVENEALALAAVCESDGKLESALEAILPPLRRYPDSAALQNLKQRLDRQIEEKRRAHENENRLDDAIKNARAAISKAEFDRATAFIAEATAIDPSRMAVQMLSRDLEIEREFQANLAAARSALAKKQFGEAEGPLNRAFEAKPSDPATRELWNRLTIERNALRAAVDEARKITNQRDYQRAVTHIETIAKQYPADSEVRELLATTVRARDIDQTAHSINNAVASKDYSHALKLARSAAKQYPSEPRFADLPNTIERLQNEGKIEDSLSKARAALAKGDIEKAEKVLAETQKLDPNNSALLQMARDLSIARENQRSQKMAPAPAPSGSPMKWAVMAAVAIVLAAGAMVAYFTRTQPIKEVQPVRIEVTPHSLDFQATAGAGAPASQNITVNGGGAFTAKSSAPWVEFKPASGSLPASIAVSVKPDSLPAGTSSTTLDIIGPSFSESIPVKVTVAKLTVVNPPKPDEPVQKEVAVLFASPESISFRQEKGGQEPMPKAVRVSGQGVTRVDARSRDFWLAVNPASASVPASFNISVHALSMAPGEYSAQVILSAPGGTRKIVPVHLTVADAPVKGTPADDQPKQQVTQATEQPTQPAGSYLGLRAGTVTWVGALAPSGKLVLGPKGVIEGLGNVVGHKFIPENVNYEVSNVPSGLQAAAAMNRLTLVNVSGTVIRNFTISWRIKQ